MGPILRHGRLPGLYFRRDGRWKITTEENHDYNTPESDYRRPSIEANDQRQESMDIVANQLLD